MSSRARAWIPWGLFALSVGLVVLSLLLLAANRARPGVHLFDFWLDLTVIAAICPITGAIIASRRPENRIGWIFCAIGLLAGVDHLSAEYAIYALLASEPPLGGGAVMASVRSSIWPLYHGLFIFLGLLFPTGALPSRRWRPVAWLTTLVIVLGAVSLALAPGPVDGLGPIQNPLGLETLRSIGSTAMVALVETVLSLLGLAAAVSLAFRVRYARGEERLQLKWFAYASAIAATGAVLTYLVADLIPGPWAGWVGWIVLQIGMLGMPVAVGIAILRYRLYDVDLIINRTLVYGALSAALVLIYFSSIVLLQTLATSLGRTGRSPLAVVVSTLAIAALFQPLRRRIQAAIDHRFYRRKYDAIKTLEEFSTRLRDDIDIGRLTEDLQTVVLDTVQPESVSLWVRAAPDDARHSDAAGARR